jgi:hypothetical protein
MKMPASHNTYRQTAEWLVNNKLTAIRHETVVHTTPGIPLQGMREKKLKLTIVGVPTDNSNSASSEYKSRRISE